MHRRRASSERFSRHSVRSSTESDTTKTTNVSGDCIHHKSIVFKLDDGLRGDSAGGICEPIHASQVKWDTEAVTSAGNGFWCAFMSEICWSLFLKPFLPNIVSSDSSPGVTYPCFIYIFKFYLLCRSRGCLLADTSDGFRSDAAQAHIHGLELPAYHNPSNT